MKLFLFLLFFIPLVAFSQHQDRALALYNVGFGGVSSGIGAVINKPKNIGWKKVFIKGFWRGSAGGLLNYSSKKMLFLINSKNEYLYAWPAKILHFAGLSIMENASLNEPFLQNWFIDYGVVRFDFSINSKKKFRARFLLESIPSIYLASKTAQFNVKSSLVTGNLVFISNKNLYVSYNGRKDLGYSFGKTIALGSNWAGSYQIMTHEIVHQFQFGDFQVFNTWLKPFERKLKSKQLKTVFFKYIYFNVPYFWGLYELAGRHNPPHYYKNFFEFEAQRFSTNKYVPR